MFLLSCVAALGHPCPDQGSPCPDVTNNQRCAFLFTFSRQAQGGKELLDLSCKGPLRMTRQGIRWSGWRRRVSHFRRGWESGCKNAAALCLTSTPTTRQGAALCTAGSLNTTAVNGGWVEPGASACCQVVKAKRHARIAHPCHHAFLESNMHHPLQLGGKLAARTVSKGPWN